MKKNKIKYFTFVPLFSIPIIAISCKNEDYSKLKLNNTYSVDINDIENVGTIFDKEITFSKKNKTTGEIYTEKVTLWDYFSCVEGEVVNVADGDTLSVNVTKGSPNGSIKINETLKIRIPFIDTLEENTTDVTEREKNLAHLDSEFAKSILPIGTKVKLISDDGWTSISYSRRVGYLFYGENYKKNFSISMLANGWTLPRINRIVFKNFKKTYKNNNKELVSDYLLPYAAHAFNKGYIENKGFYDKNGVNIKLNGKTTNLKFKNPTQFSKEYKSHGETIINDAYRFMYTYNIDKIYRNEFKNSEENIYEFLKNNQKNN